MEENTKKSNKWVWVLILVAVIVVVFLLATDRISLGVNSDTYQAVFLTNNQVYFGKLNNKNSQFPVLKDVYYLQITQALQPKSQNAAATNINLVKLGGEIHAPQDAMSINRDQIVFIEDLKPDSQVVTAIKQYKGNQK